MAASRVDRLNRKWPIKDRLGRNTITDRYEIIGANLDANQSLQLYRENFDNADADNNKGLVINQNDSTNNPIGLEILNAGLGASISIDADGTHATTKVVGIAIDVDNAGAGDQVALDIDMVDEAKSYFARFNATTGWTSTKSPEIDAEAGWIKIMVGSTAQFIPYYDAS